MSQEGRIITDIIYLFERMNITLDKNDISKDIKEKEYIISSLAKIKDAMEKNNFENLSIDRLDTENKTVMQITKCLERLIVELPKLETLKGKKVEFYEVPNDFKTTTIMKNSFNVSSLRVSYALRLSIAVTILIFIVNYFNIPEGKWIVYTIFSLTQPYAEGSKARVRQRIEGTLIVCAVFFVVKAPALRGIVMLLAGYLNPFAKGDKQTMILVTVTAVASAAMMGGELNLAILRVLMVIIGTAISVLTTKFLFPYSLNDGNDELEDSYQKVVALMKKDVQVQDDENVIKSLYLMPA